jgi:ABA DEFICIENT 4-like
VKTGQDNLFLFVTVLPLPFWVLMIALPNWRGTQRVMQSRLAVIPLLAVYAVLIIPQLPGILSLFVRAEPVKLDELARFLGRPDATLVAWIHVLAFDLFVGRWAYRDSRQRRIPVWLTAPILLLLMLFGPLGLLLYLLVRTQFRAEHLS